MATHSSTLAWKIACTEEPGRLQSMVSQSWTWLSDFTTFSSLTGSPIKQMFDVVPTASAWCCSINPLSYLHFKKILCCCGWVSSIALSSGWLILYSAPSSLLLDPSLLCLWAQSLYSSLCDVCLVLSYIFCLSVEVLTVLIHSSYRFSEQLYDHDLGLFIRQIVCLLLIFFFSWDFILVFLWNTFLCFLISLGCVCFYVVDETATFPSHEGVALCQRWTLFTLVLALGCPLKLWDCPSSLFYFLLALGFWGCSKPCQGPERWNHSTWIQADWMPHLQAATWKYEIHYANVGPVALQRFTPLAPEQAFWRVSPPGQRFTPLAPEQAFWCISPPGQRFTPLAPEQAFWHVSPPGEFVVSASLTHFSVAFFSFSTRVGVAQVVFRPFSEEIVPRVAVDPVWPWEEVSSGSWWVAILSHLLRLHFMFHFSPSFPFPKLISSSLSPARCLEFFCFVFMIIPETWTIAQKETPFLLNVL